MVTVTVQLTERQVETLRARTGVSSVPAALKAWVAAADARRSTAELRAALKESLQEEASGKGRRFRTARGAVRWLEN
jgi:hypothetical protein